VSAGIGAQQEGSSGTFTEPTSSEQSNVRSYVSDIDGLVDQLRGGAKSRFEVVTAITQFLNADEELTSQEKAHSFELYMAEIEAVEGAVQEKGKGRSVGERTSKGEKMAAVLGTGKVTSNSGEPIQEESVLSSDSDEDEPASKKRKL
jgi:hypothetical protein